MARVTPLMAITVFDEATGQARYVTAVADEAEADACCAPGQVWRAGEHDGRLDPETGEPAGLLEFDLTITTGLIAGIPPGTMAFWKLEKVQVDDGTLEIEADLALPESVRVKLLHPAYHPATVWVDVLDSTP